MTKLALVADNREWLVMHESCARAADPARTMRGDYWYAADVVNATSELLDDPCTWCQEKLRDAAKLQS